MSKGKSGEVFGYVYYRKTRSRRLERKNRKNQKNDTIGNIRQIGVMGGKRMLRGNKEITSAIEAVWGVTIGECSIWKWNKDKDDPLPIRRIRIGQNKSILTADPSLVEAWAQRRIA